MSKIFSTFLFLILFFLIFSLRAQDVDVTGEWELTMETRRGEMTQEVIFAQEGENLTVTMTGMRGDEVTGEGTVKEIQIEWTITRSTPRGEFSMSFTGTVEGDTMSGEVEIGNFGTNEWTAKRK